MMGDRTMGKGRRPWRPRMRNGSIATVLSVCVGMGSVPAALVAQEPLDRSAGITVQEETLEAALTRLQRTAGVALVYSPDLLPSERLVDCACDGATVREALRTLLEGTGFTFSANRSLIRLVPDREARTEAASVIRGRILEAERDAPVVNAMIRLDNGRGVLSNANGQFVIRDLASGLHRMEVSSIGWRPEVRSVDLVGADTVFLTIRLRRVPIPLPAIVVAPGTFGMLEAVTPGTTTTLTREELALMPQVGEDVLRAVRRLPGVASDDISTRLNVRGGTDREVLVRLDGLELYEPYHLKDWNGILGIVDVHALGGVQLTSGGFGAEFGNKTAGVLDMSSRTSLGPARTTLGVSISNVTAMSRGGFADGRGAWLLSGRRGFLDLVLDLIDENPVFSPQYYDVFGKLTYQLSNDHVLSAHALHAGDVFVYQDQPPEGVDEADIDTSWDSSYGWLTWKATPGSRFASTTILSTGRMTRNRSGYVIDEDDTPQQIDTEDHRSSVFAGLRNDASVQLSPSLLLKFGGEVKRLRADYDFENRTRYMVLTPDTAIETRHDSVRVDMEPEGHEVGAYLAARMRPTARLVTEVGVRYDRISYTDDRDVSPRLLASYDLSERTTARASWGRYHQPQGIHELEVGDGETEFLTSERADQIALGLEHHFSSGVNARVELYRRWISDQRPVFLNAEQEIHIFPEAASDRMIIAPDRGRAQGLEVLLERKSGRRLAWSANYTLAVAEDRVDGRWVPRRFDQRHTIGIHTAYTPSQRWRVSLGWKYHSGWPATSWTWDVVTLSDGSNSWHRRFGPLRAERVPAYHRMDVRVTRDFTVRGNPLHVFVDLFNVYDRTNLGSYSYVGNYSGGRMHVARINGQEQMPLLPMFGLRYEF